MVKIRNANKNGTLAASLEDGMKADGYVKGAEADWVKVTGGWLFKLKVKPVVAAPEPPKKEPEPSSPAASGTD